MTLAEKNAVVTGAASGIGRAIAEIILQNGGKVALLDVDATTGEGLLETLNKQHGAGKALFLKCDVQSDEEVKASFQKAVETFGRIDILCNNAGIMDEGAWEKTLNINLMGVIRGTYAALSHMNKLAGGQGGIVINTASMAGIGPFPSCPAYTAAKSGVVGFTRAMAAASHVSGFGIRFNVLCPGFVQTDLINNIKEKLGEFGHLVDLAQSLIDKLGIITVSEVADCFLELVNDESKNGEALVVFSKGKHYMTFPSAASKE